MSINTVIFDMDGILVNSEPLWQQAANTILSQFNIQLTPQQYVQSTGLRTPEFLQYWFRQFNIDKQHLPTAEKEIVEEVIRLVKHHQPVFDGVPYIFDFFAKQNFKIAIATSSPQNLIDTVVELAGIEKYLQATASADDCKYGKPNPEVYLLAAQKLQSLPHECVCFEDSVNGMVAAKAAGMKCVVIPEHEQAKNPKFALADMQLSSLKNFNQLLLLHLQQ